MEPWPGDRYATTRVHARRGPRQPNRPQRGTAQGPTGTVALAPAIEVDGCGGAQTLRARLLRYAGAPELRPVLGDVRHRGQTRSLPGAGIPPDWLVRHAAYGHAAQLRGST